MSGNMTPQTVFAAILLYALTTISLANAADNKENATKEKAAAASIATPMGEKPKVTSTANTGAAKGKEKMGVPDDSIRTPTKK